ncbi:SIR2 family protein [Yersinia enterocolitica]|uniref:SIR2 family protein n=1 Tax=Yersinia enterocolitica TaxID=630 RepID=UPI0027ED246C|nr:SIR2 family protein [Yersinia enterocolitica]
MNIHDFIGNYRNHPVLFIGAGISLRYLKNSYTWDGLLRQVAGEIESGDEYYLDIKAEAFIDGAYRYDKIAAKLESDFNELAKTERNGKFEEINNIFYDSMAQGVPRSRFKIYISELLKDLKYKEWMLDEIAELKKTRKNIGSVISTNYDLLIEDIFEFNPLIGNDILLSNPYGSIYKIHGCVTDPNKIIITDNDYTIFNAKYELIRAQLLSIFIHNPIIFMGYNIGDDNIRDILKTIFTYIEQNTDDAVKIRSNFLLVEYMPDLKNHEIVEHDIVMDGFSTIRINKIKTDDFKTIYKALSDISLPISAMDVRKVQNIVKEIYSGGDIKVNITENLDTLNNNDRILAIGSSKTISYQYQNSSELMSNYYKILDESNSQILVLINKYTLRKDQYFPVFGFSKIYDGIINIEQLKMQQIEKVSQFVKNTNKNCESQHKTINDINIDNSISTSKKESIIACSLVNNYINVNDMEEYLRSYEEKEGTNYRKLLCLYDYIKYSDDPKCEKLS